MVARRAAWVPERQDVIWIDCHPQAEREMRDPHPLLVLSPKTFNDRTSLVIGLPMTTAAYNASNPFAVAAGVAGGRKLARRRTCFAISPSRSTGARRAASRTRTSKSAMPCWPKCC